MAKMQKVCGKTHFNQKLISKSLSKSKHKLIIVYGFNNNKYVSYSDWINVAKCKLGEVKLERVGLRSSPIAVCGMRGCPLGSCRASLGACS